MCGFTGFINFEGKKHARHILEGMTDSIKHRGPDNTSYTYFSLTNKRIQTATDSHIEFEGGVGFNRLSILDLSALGNQPMIEREANLILAFNGEIYNAFDYVDMLHMAGVRLKSKTDSEILLQLIKLKGVEKTIGMLNGMFSICLIDLKSGTLHLVRDRLGIKPLYYTQVGRTLLFSSEIKAFLKFEDFVPELNNESISEFFTFRSIVDGNTLLKGVHEVLPGQHLKFTRDNTINSFFWDVPDANPMNIDFNQALDLVESSFTQSVKSRLLSDVKIGMQLSGGVDSSLVTAYATKYLNAKNLDAISIDIDDPKLSEMKWIESVSNQLGIKNHTFKLSENYFFENLAKASWHMDQPIAHPNSLGIFLLSEKAKEYFTVFLSGEGADELFAGYPRFFLGYLLNQLPLSRWPLSLSKKVAKVRSNYHHILKTASFDKESFFVLSSVETNAKLLKRLFPDYNPLLAAEGRIDLMKNSKGSFPSPTGC